jgi:hypothetical protein
MTQLADRWIVQKFEMIGRLLSQLRPDLNLFLNRAAVVVEGANVTALNGGRHHVSSWTCIQYHWHCVFCWAILALTIYAFPFFVAANVGIVAFSSRAGVVGFLSAAPTAGLTFLFGQLAFATARSLLLRGASLPSSSFQPVLPAIIPV